MKKLKDLLFKIGHKKAYPLELGDILTLKEAMSHFKALELQVKSLKYAVEKDPKCIVISRIIDDMRKELEE